MSEKSEIVKLTSAEISAIWTTYMNINVVICFMAHFLETCDDPDILEILKESNQLARAHETELEQLFAKEEIVIPTGFKVETHVVSHAPKLFSDVFYIQSVLQMSQFGVATHTANLTISAREDIRKMFKKFIDDVSDFYNKVVNCMQEKGIYIRMPSMNYPSEVDYINKESILTGWFGRRRPLLAVEVTHLALNAIQNNLGKVICTGFSQVTQDREIQNFFLRGKELCKQISTSIYDILEENDVPLGMSSDQSLTKSTVAPFSEQFMLYVIGILSGLGIAGYGAGLSTTMRRDISAMYASFITKTGAFVEDGLNLMIEREWMEQPPKIADRNG